jgi:hypothetical protein
MTTRSPIRIAGDAFAEAVEDREHAHRLVNLLNARLQPPEEPIYQMVYNPPPPPAIEVGYTSSALWIAASIGGFVGFLIGVWV